MKILASIICLFLSIPAFSQTSDKVTDTIPLRNIVDTSKHSDVIRGLSSAYLNIPTPLILIDGAIYKGDINSIDPKEILGITILRSIDAPALKHDTPENTILIETRKGAVTAYKNNFSKFSKKYTKYLSDNNNDDSDYRYVVNGELVGGKSTESINKLYSIPLNKIKSVGCFENQWRNGGNTPKEVVVIVTKKY